MQYFSFQEFERSETAYRHGIDNTIPTEDVRRNIAALVDTVLDPLRRTWGQPLTVTSGYRCPDLNRAVGGAPYSHHLKGCAADISAGSAKDNRRLAQLFVRLGLPFDEVINEKGFQWLHIAYRRDGLNRHLFKTYRNGIYRQVDATIFLNS